jgi:TPR repeat protein
MNTFRPRLQYALLALLPSLAFASTAATDPYAAGYDLALAGDYRTAYDVWKPLAMSGDGRAQFNLGLMYHGGLYVDPNEAAAVDWYRAAAENGVREAQEYMYVAYQEGWFGLPKADAQADYWAGRLAENPS